MHGLQHGFEEPQLDHERRPFNQSGSSAQPQTHEDHWKSSRLIPSARQDEERFEAQFEAQWFETGLHQRGWAGGEEAATPDAGSDFADVTSCPQSTLIAQFSLSSGEELGASSTSSCFDALSSTAASSETTIRSPAVQEEREVQSADAARAPSFLPEQLEFEDPRAIDFRNYMCVWFVRVKGGTPTFDEIHRDDLASWAAWSLCGVPLEELVAERGGPT